MVENKLERLDFSLNPQFYDNYIFLYINKDNFYFDDFINFKNLNFDLSVPTSIKLENMDLDFLRIFYSLPQQVSKVPNISNSKIKILDIMSHISKDGSTPLNINRINMKDANVNRLNIQNILVNNTLDLSELDYNRDLIFWGLDAKKIIFANSHESVFINNINIKMPQLYKIDLKTSKNLINLEIKNCSNLREVLYNKTSKTDFITLANNDFVESYKFNRTIDTDPQTEAMGAYKNDDKASPILRLRGY